MVVPSHVMDLPFNDYLSVVTRKNEEGKTELLTEVKPAKAEVIIETPAVETPMVETSEESVEVKSEPEEGSHKPAPNKVIPRNNKFKKTEESK